MILIILLLQRVVKPIMLGVFRILLTANLGDTYSHPLFYFANIKQLVAILLKKKNIKIMHI